MSDVSAVAEIGAAGEGGGGEAGRYLTFTLNGEAYALDIFHVNEIIEYRRLTVVPMMPAFVRGVINLRGRAVPVIDLAVRFDRGTTAVARRTSIIIVHLGEADAGVSVGGPSGGGSAAGLPGVGSGPAADRDRRGGQDIGILVDAVNTVEAFAAEDIEPAPAFGAGIRAEYIAGMARRDAGFIIVLDVDRVLSVGDMIAAAGAAAEAVTSATDESAVPAGAAA